MSKAEFVVSVDRVEGEYVVLDWEGQGVPVSRSRLGSGFAEGDVLRVTLEVDPELTRARRREVEERLSRLASGDDGGDVDL